MHFVSLKNLSFTSSGFCLSPINLDIKKGEFFAILGSSGSGKTFLLESIAGLRDIKINTAYDEASDNYLVSFKTDNSDDEKYNTVLEIAGDMLTEVAFDAINSEVISHLGLPSERDKPAMRVLD